MRCRLCSHVPASLERRAFSGGLIEMSANSQRMRKFANSLTNPLAPFLFVQLLLTTDGLGT